MSLTTGTRLGPYEILGAIGAGGMGEVYKARDTRLDRIVALKVILPASAPSLEFRERFEREARAIAALDHPHICTLHDVGHEHRQTGNRQRGPGFAMDGAGERFLLVADTARELQATQAPTPLTVVVNWLGTLKK